MLTRNQLVFLGFRYNGRNSVSQDDFLYSSKNMHYK